MKDIRMILPNIASDTAGAASALFPLGGLTVIHDGAGSLEVFVTFDEPRDLEGRRTVTSHLSRLEAITGDDGILLDKLNRACSDDPPPFIAIVGSPVPFTLGTDLDGIAAEAEFSTGIPAFAVTAGGFGTYDRGAGEALQKLIEKATRPPAPHEGYTVNLLGATPLDYSQAEIDGMKARLLAQGAARVNSLTMTDGMEEIYHAAEADRNLVISAAGLPAARYMEKTFGIPYSVGTPVADTTAATLRCPPEKRGLILGEAVLAKQLAQLLSESGISAVAGITANDDPEIFPDVPSLRLGTEADIRAELNKEYFAILGDPLYKLLLPPDSKTIFIERPHRAQSSRLYAPSGQVLEQYISKLKRCFQ